MTYPTSYQTIPIDGLSMFCREAGHHQVCPYSLPTHRNFLIVTTVATHVADAASAVCEFQHV